MMTLLHRLFYLAIAQCCLISLPTAADITLNPLFSHGAVLQREQPIPIWGRAEPNAEIKVTLGTQERLTTSDPNGKWLVEFPPSEAGGPMFLNIESDNDKTSLVNIMIGDVWVCGGQSNMEWILKDSLHGPDEIEITDYPGIRHFKVPHTWSAEPASVIEGDGWVSARKAKASEFSAVAYYFAKKVHRETGVPIGLIGANWSGSNIESWMSPSALGENPEVSKERIEQINQQFHKQNSRVSKLLKRWPNALQNKATEGLADWSAADLNTGDWRTLYAPQLWEEQDLPNLDGVIWYRKNFNLNANEAKLDAQLNLARIDDQDTVWVNGKKVGGTDAYNILRQYSVPANYLQEGKNTIAIRIVDNGGGGGIYSEKELLFLELANGHKHSLVGDWRYKADKVYVNNEAGMQYVPTALYNKMIHPLFMHPVKGVIWYQGESNAGTIQQAQNYRAQFQNLISDWRDSWNQPKLPFYWVQLASYNSRKNTPQGSPWAILRQSQTDALRLSHTGQVITLDVGNAEDIHPRDKRTVGNRLANIALHKTYQKTAIQYRGPYQTGIRVDGNTIIVHLHTSNGLTTKNGQEQVQGFEVIFANGKTKLLTGKIVQQTVHLSVTDANSAPAAVRYAWDDNPESANLQDKNGLPAEPFLAPIKARETKRN